MAFSKQKVSLRHLLVLFYVITVMLLIALLVRERHSEMPPFSLSHVSIEQTGNSTALSVFGEKFHSDLKGVFARSLANENALLWHQLSGAPSAALDVKGDLALVSCKGNMLVSIGLHDGTSPEILGSVQLPGTARQVRIAGDHALVALQRYAGFVLVDLKDPRTLKLVGHYPQQGFVLSMVVDRSIIYYADFYYGIGRIDLSAKNPAPERLVSVSSPWRIALQDNKMVVGTTKDGVHLFDITEAGRLIEAGHLESPAAVRGVAFADEALAVALADNTLQLLDLSSWPNLSVSSQLTLPGNPLLLERIPGQAGLAVGLVAGGVAVIDASRPASAAISGLLKMPTTFLGLKLQPGRVYGASLKGVEAFSLDKITGGASLAIAAETGYEPDHYQLHVWNGHVYGSANNRLVDFGEAVGTDLPQSGRFLAVAEDEGVGIFEQNESGGVERFGSIALADRVRAACFRGNELYLVHYDGLQILSGVRPEEMVVMSNLRLPGQPRHLKILDSGFLLVVTRDDGVLVVDVNDPRRPVQVASLVLPLHQQSIYRADDVLIDGSLAYISYGAGGVHIVDMSSPSRPELLEIVDTPGNAGVMTLHDNLLMVADGPGGLFMIDVKNRQGALPIGTLQTPLRVDQMAIAGGSLIVSGHPGGTMQLPLPQRMQDLQLVNSGEVRVDVEKVENGQYVYLYDERAWGRAEVDIQQGGGD